MFEAWNKFNEKAYYPDGTRQIFFAGAAFGALQARFSEEDLLRAMQDAAKLAVDESKAKGT